MYWHEEDSHNLIYVNENTGQIMGRINISYGSSKKTCYAFLNSAILGEYVSVDFAKKAIENKLVHKSVTESKP